jgi:hypothetical protein
MTLCPVATRKALVRRGSAHNRWLKCPIRRSKKVGIKRFEDDDSDVAWMGDEDESAASLADRIGLERRET